MMKLQIKEIKKINETKDKNSRIRKRIFYISIILLCIVAATYVFNVFAAQKNAEKENMSLENTESKKLNLQFVDSLYTYEEPVLEETQAATEAETQAETETVIIQPVIPVKDLEIATDNLSDPEENKQVEVVPVAEEKKVEFPTSEIAKLVYGVDVSSYQGKIDWAQVKADGVEFAIIRVGYRGYGTGAGEGKLHLDEYYERNIEGAVANGIQVGVYYFSQAINEQEALEEASLVIDAISKYKKQITFPVIIDWESGDDYRTNCGLSKDKLTSIISKFCDTVASIGYTPMAYLGNYDWNHAVNASVLTSKYKAWQAYYFHKYYDNPDARNWYTFGEELPDSDFAYQMWQYTSRGHVAGISTRVDMDIAFFTYSDHKVDKIPVTLTVPNTTITTNVGKSVDFMAGVSAKNSIGFDATSGVSLSIFDWENSDVSSDYAWPINHPGNYKLYYRFTDPTGEKKEVIATLTVRDFPSVSIKAYNIDYTNDITKTETANYDALIKILKDNIVATSYEGKVLPVEIKNLDIQLKAGTYSVNYVIDDGLGLSKTETITVTVNQAQ